jgi:hypothetical protein
MLHVGVGSLGHSPDSLLEGPRLMVDSAQRAEDENVRFGGSCVQRLYAFARGLVALRIAGFLFYIV